MSLHPPKTITSIEGLGVNTTKTMKYVDDHISIGTEVWNEMKAPWEQSGIIIAEPGYSWVTKWEVEKPFVVTKFLDAAGNLIGIYCDVSRPVQRLNDGFSFTDLYLDVWQTPKAEPTILDEDELVDAVHANYISFEEAKGVRRVAEDLISHLKNDPEFLEF